MAAIRQVDPATTLLRRLAVLSFGGATIPPALERMLAGTTFSVQAEAHGAHAVAFVGGEAAVAEAAAALRAAADTALLPVLAVVERSASSQYLDPAWRDACDAVIAADAQGSAIAAALERLERVSAAVAQLPADSIFPGEAEKRRVRALRWIASREIESLAPKKSASSPRLHRWGALDAICGANVEADLAALERAGLLRKSFADRLYRCGCGDARLVFRDACGKCGSTHVEMRALLRHRCGHAAPSGEFWRGEELVCPGCDAPLAQGEYEGPQEEPCCEACGTFAKDGLTIATCLGCGETSDASKLAAVSVASYALTQQGKVALLAVPGEAGGADRERRDALIAAWKKLAKGQVASLVRYTAVTATGAELDELLAGALRGGDHAVRVGGNSFLALLTGTRRDGAMRFVQRFALRERAGAITPATQVHCWPEDTDAFAAALRALET